MTPSIHLSHLREFDCGLLITSTATGMPGPIADIYLLEHCEIGSGASGSTQTSSSRSGLRASNWQLPCTDKESFVKVARGGNHEW